MRSLVEDCFAHQCIRNVDKVAFTREDGGVDYLRINLKPISFEGDQHTLAVSITFDDVTAFFQLNQSLRSAHEELETTNEELESTNEELETTNEELQSTNEELEATNEELQSANEELETTNAELQSTNEELESINDELRLLTLEVEQTNTFLQNILTSLRHGIAVLDKAGVVKVWNKHCEELWGLRSDEVVGKNFFSLDIGLPVQELKSRLQSDELSKPRDSVLLEAVNRRGKKFDCLVRAAALKGRRQDGGEILLFEDRAH